uniref:Uncharacterized protein n=1 Tax=Romanomermis culicivorax TaxID=13658 RepID=A0A915J7R3_ROMCU
MENRTRNVNDQEKVRYKGAVVIPYSGQLTKQLERISHKYVVRLVAISISNEHENAIQSKKGRQENAISHKAFPAIIIFIP